MTVGAPSVPASRSMRPDRFLGRVPETWTTGAFRHYVQVREGQVDPRREDLGGMSLIAPNHVESGTGRLLSLESAADQGAESGKYWCDAGDVIYSKIRPALRKVAVAPTDCLCSADMYPLKGLNGLTNRFLYWYLLSEPFSDFALRESMRVAMPKVNRETLAEALIPVPSPGEQERIVNFLDEQTARIDALIAEKEQLIERLGEYEEASIVDAILGVSETVSRSTVNVPEVASIPKSWALIPMMRLTDPARPIMYGIVLPGPNVEQGPSVPIVKGGDVRPHRLRIDLLNRTTPELEAPYARARLRPLDIVYSIRGTIGDAELVPAELEGANITQDVARIAPSVAVEPRWLLYAAKSRAVFAQLEQLSLGAAVRGINIFDLKRARVPTPPRSQQTAIADHLDRLLTKLAALRDHSQTHAIRLREYRTSLISAAVTGQLDISTFQAKAA
jgi:type I restriction enzyme S subunit